MDFKFILFSQYPLFFLLCLFCLGKYTLVRKRSAVKSVLFVILFGVLLAAAVVCCFLGMQMQYWSMSTVAKLNGWSIAGLCVFALIVLLSVAHNIEARLNRRKLDKAMKQAEKIKETEVRRAREEAINEERSRAAEESAAANAADSPEEPLPTDVLKEFL